MTEPVIRFDKVSVRYRVPHEGFSGIKEFSIRWLQRKLAFDDFWALKDISFDVRRGENFGIIGRNGSGKSTLLKVIARVLPPSRGRVVIRGKVAPLLEVGAAFHPELTGRENVFLNSALLGRTKSEARALLPEIAAFSEIGDFMNAPLRTYSTGMVARLGFAVATAVRPEILLVDEVLSVGDAAFQQKCLDRMYSFQEQGTTVILVSHSMATIESFCDRAVWLEQGELRAAGSTREVSRRYVEASQAQSEILESPARVAAPSLTSPIPRAEPELIPEQQTAHLPEIRCIYPADPILSVRHGTISLWIRFLPRRAHSTAILFHSDDSRYVIYTSADENGYALTARAGGNRRVMETFFGESRFPEVTVSSNDQTLDRSFADGDWHMVAMTWDGYPDGKVRLYVDARPVGEADYDRRYDNNYRLAESLAVGVRPPQWVGELIQREDGTMEDLRPQATLSVAEGGQQMDQVYLYRECLSPDEIKTRFESERALLVAAADIGPG
ncbi:MAG TPA: ATP-binding cassette domain-containing protein [Anaerolineales bacterium]|nr:ATP-binding cassette domain-containing protein [Anaerolineales bacterium]